MKPRIFVLFSLLMIYVLALSACISAAPAPTQAPAATEIPVQALTEALPTEKPAPANPTLILATTTSTQDSGLLDVLISLFEAE